jgi:large subunit ribosomal protein L20
MTGFNKKRIFRMAKGFNRTGKNCVTVATPRLHKSLNYAYISRRLKKRNVRTGWIKSINAAVREHDLPYSRFVYGLNHSNIKLDRKVLSQLSITEPFTFKAVVDEVKQQTQLGLE